MEKNAVRKHYRENREEIDSRLEEFRDLKEASEERLFRELVFVILTSQSSAKNAWDASLKLEKLGLLEKPEKSDITEILAEYSIQYEERKASYIANNRKKLSQPTLEDPSGKLKLKGKIDPDNLESTRKWLAENLDGISWKGASHFLRNIGHGNSFAIISSRIISKLHELEVVDNQELPKNREKYLQVERKMQALSEDLGIDVKALDLVLWSMETGEVFR